ncbi:MAG: transcriptional regulator [Gammaproteobacteria bacterium]|nr:transcriptional regulator [Gammaproteobacteria bacterium]
MPATMCPGKSVHIIVNATFENELVRVLDKVGVTGYTQLDARGNGYSGVQDGHSEGETNVMFIVLVTSEVAEVLIESLIDYIKRGYPIVSYTSDVEVLTTNKYGKPTI